jgi:serine/threonine protein kinase
MEGGSLDRILWMKKYELKRKPSWKQRLQILHDVADGMTYVHKIVCSIHRDLKSPNVLLTQDTRKNSDVEFRAKVADFGLTRVLDSVARRKHVKKKLQAAVVSSDEEDEEEEDTDESSDEEQDGGGKKSEKNLKQTMTSERGTVPWMAPELFISSRTGVTLEYSQSVDVYAFGCVCWEALCLNQPWGRARSVSFSTIRNSVTSGQRPTLPSNLSSEVPNGFVSIIVKCWSQDPNNRPSFPVLLSKLQQILIDYHKTQQDTADATASTTTNNATIDYEVLDDHQHKNDDVDGASTSTIEMISISSGGDN